MVKLGTYQSPRIFDGQGDEPFLGAGEDACRPQNPVKAGLASKAVDGEYSRAGDWLDGKIGRIPIAKDFRWTG
jgi:hypothetical protein